MIAAQHEPSSASGATGSGWNGDIREFVSTDPSTLVDQLSEHHARSFGDAPPASQVRAWRSSVRLLADALSTFLTSRPDAADWGVILEYELPRERGRRPDVIVLAPGRLIIVEFKEEPLVRQSHVDQVLAYARDLGNYHAASHRLRTLPVLVSPDSQPDRVITGDDRLYCVQPAGLTSLITELLDPCNGKPENLEAWLRAEYEPLPTLVAAARLIFQHEPLPSIRQARSAGIPDALAHLTAVAERAKAASQRHLVLLTGVPGAGKTLVGLQFVYATHFEGVDEEKEAVFLSGNGPLVKVLQHALKSSVFVQDVHGFLRQYGGDSSRVPREHIWVYDEAQRAWDAEQVKKKRQHDRSEPEDFVLLGERVDEWSMLIGLIGDGQEIHNGEEAGLGQWRDALRMADTNWYVHCPPRIAGVFDGMDTVTATNALDLTVSLRSHLAADVQDWIRELLNGRLDQAGTAASRAQSLGYVMYVTDDIDAAKRYVRSRYSESPSKRYGLLASSKAKGLEPYGFENSFAFTRRLREGPWYNDEPNSPHSCCQLRETATEFQAQGLELDLPIVAWGRDLTWGGTEWISPPSPRSQAKDPHQLRLNSYRVLLSRGRDGVIVFVPPELPEIQAVLEIAGMLRLPSTAA